ncbi:hypothetical protein IGJ55_003231 [Enterococcus sp. AZ170]|uniref:hypothetical protein n=1 Tax=unclassified Enterococcus TaxID=2608891 RepID=UPI003D2D0678
MGKIEYYIKQEKITQRKLVIVNNSEKEKLFQLLFEDELFKIIHLYAREIKEYVLQNDAPKSIKVLEIH